MSLPNDPTGPKPPPVEPASGELDGASSVGGPVETVPSVPGQFAPVPGAEPDSLAAVVASVEGAQSAPPFLPGAAAPVAVAPEGAAAIASSPPSQIEEGPRPTFMFFGTVAAISLVLDVASKAWAEVVLGKRTMIDPALVLVENQLTLTLAYNKGGAWGLLQDASANVRKPFFLAVSVLAIAFIVSLYGRLASGQRALKWGLPLVLGGALGNLSDRIVRNSVIDFIDFRSDWVRSMNEFVAVRIWPSWSVTDHWPTFNVADISICIGVGLMAVDMITSKRTPSPSEGVPSAAALPADVAPPGPAGSVPEPAAPPTDVPTAQSDVAAQAVPEGEEAAPPTLASPDSGAMAAASAGPAVPLEGAAPSVPEAAGPLSAGVLPGGGDPSASGRDPSA